MPEGSSIRIYNELLQKYKNKTIKNARGKTKKIKINKIINQKIIDIFKIGKVLFIKLNSGDIIRLHFLLFGSINLNSESKTTPILEIYVDNDKIRFNTNSIKLLTNSEFNKLKLDITLDPTDKKYSKSKSKIVFKKYINSHPNEIIADTLMNQNIFPGIGNIIKNESLYLAKINPNRRLQTLNETEINEIINCIRSFSLNFYKMEKRENYDNLNIYYKDYCPNGEKIIKKEIGKLKRMTMWCTSIQK